MRKRLNRKRFIDEGPLSDPKEMAAWKKHREMQRVADFEKMEGQRKKVAQQKFSYAVICVLVLMLAILCSTAVVKPF